MQTSPMQNRARVTVVVFSALMLIGAVVLLTTEDTGNNTSVLYDTGFGKVICSVHILFECRIRNSKNNRDILDVICVI